MYILPVHTLPAHRSAASPRIETGQEEGADLDLQNHSAKLMSSWYLLLLVWKEIETLQFLRNILPSFNIQAGSGIVPRFDNRPTSPSRTWSMQILVEPHSSQTTQKGITWFELITISSFVCEIWSCQQKISVACSKKKTVDSSKLSSQSQVLHVSFRSVWRVQQVQEVGIGWSNDFYHEKGCDWRKIRGMNFLQQIPPDG